MALKKVGKGSQYAFTYLDSNGNPLDGSKTYKVNVPANVPAKDFWSFTLYDNQTRSMLQTDAQFPRSGAMTRKSYRIKMDPTISTSLLKRRKAKRATGSRLYPGRVGTRSSAFTVRLSPGLIRHGGRARLSWSSMPVAMCLAPVMRNRADEGRRALCIAEWGLAEPPKAGARRQGSELAACGDTALGVLTS
jgi:hypothetical protein